MACKKTARNGSTTTVIISIQKNAVHFVRNIAAIILWNREYFVASSAGGNGTGIVSAVEAGTETKEFGKLVGTVFNAGFTFAKAFSISACCQPLVVTKLETIISLAVPFK